MFDNIKIMKDIMMQNIVTILLEKVNLTTTIGGYIVHVKTYKWTHSK